MAGAHHLFWAFAGLLPGALRLARVGQTPQSDGLAARRFLFLHALMIPALTLAFSRRHDSPESTVETRVAVLMRGSGVKISERKYFLPRTTRVCRRCVPHQHRMSAQAREHGMIEGGAA